MQSTKRKCDNPSCDEHAFPESFEKPYIAPYHWVVARGLIIGQAKFKVEVCSPECLGPAVTEAWRESEEH